MDSPHKAADIKPRQCEPGAKVGYLPDGRLVERKTLPDGSVRDIEVFDEDFPDAQAFTAEELTVPEPPEPESKPESVQVAPDKVETF